MKFNFSFLSLVADQPTTTSGGLSGGSIAGIIIGILVLLVFVGFFLEDKTN